MSGQEMALADRIEATPSYPVEHFGGSWRRVDKPGTKDADNHRVILVSEESRDLIVAGLRRPAPTEPDIRAALESLPKPETMLTYASILEKPQYQIDPKTGVKYRLATGEIVEAACAALRYCAALSHAGDTGREPVAWQFQALSGAWNDCGDPDPRHVAKNPHRYRALYASAQPSARIGRESYPFLAALSTTLKTMKSAHDNGGERLMSIWLDDVQAVEAAILSLTAIAPAGGAAPQFEIRRNPDGSIDEIVGSNCLVHIEQMTAHSWFASFDTPDGAQHRFWFGSKNRKSAVGFSLDEVIRPQGPTDTARDAGSDAVSRAHGKTGDARS